VIETVSDRPGVLTRPPRELFIGQRRGQRVRLCGELLDAFGPIGGYNFLWAWATGRAAGLGAAGYTVDLQGRSPAP